MGCHCWDQKSQCHSPTCRVITKCPTGNTPSILHPSHLSRVLHQELRPSHERLGVISKEYQTHELTCVCHVWYVGGVRTGHTTIPVSSRPKLKFFLSMVMPYGLGHCDTSDRIPNIGTNIDIPLRRRRVYASLILGVMEEREEKKNRSLSFTINVPCDKNETNANAQKLRKGGNCKD